MPRVRCAVCADENGADSASDTVFPSAESLAVHVCERVHSPADNGRHATLFGVRLDSAWPRDEFVRVAVSAVNAHIIANEHAPMPASGNSNPIAGDDDGSRLAHHAAPSQPHAGTRRTRPCTGSGSHSTPDVSVHCSHASLTRIVDRCDPRDWCRRCVAPRARHACRHDAPRK